MSAPVPRIAAWKVIVASAYFVFERRAAFTRALALPAAAMVLLEVAASFVVGPFAHLMVTLLHYAVQTVFAVTAHRLVLLGPAAVSVWALAHWGRREWRFMRYLFGVGILGSVPAAAVTALFLSHAGFAILMPFALGWMLVVVARLSIVFPAVALDRPLDLRGAWAVSRAHLWPLVTVSVLYPVGLTIPAIALASLPYGGLPGSLFGLVATALVVAALSFAYREVTRREDLGLLVPGED